jgi:hypothetical protein
VREVRTRQVFPSEVTTFEILSRVIFWHGLVFGIFSFRLTLP